MPRIVTIIVIFLLIGCAINIAVAWTFICRAPLQQWSYTSVNNEPWPAPSLVPPAWPITANVGRFEKVGLTEIDAVGEPYRDGDFKLRVRSQWVLQAGWPLRSLFVENHHFHPRPRFSPRWEYADESSATGFEIPDWLVESEPIRARRRLPLRPVWTGFIINSLFFGGVPFIVAIAPIVLIRANRRRRHRCPRCGYPIGASPVCTECGKPIRRHPRHRS